MHEDDLIVGFVQLRQQIAILRARRIILSKRASVRRIDLLHPFVQVIQRKLTLAQFGREFLLLLLESRGIVLSPLQGRLLLFNAPNVAFFRALDLVE